MRNEPKIVISNLISMTSDNEKAIVNLSLTGIDDYKITETTKDNKRKMVFITLERISK